MENEIKKRNGLDIAILVVTVLIGLYHVVNTMWLIFSQSQTRVVHICCGIIVVYLLSLKKSFDEKKTFGKIVSIILLAIGIGASCYFFFNAQQLELALGIPTKIQTIMGVVLLVIVFEANIRAWGWVIPICVLVAMLYGLFGQFMPGLLHHGGLSIKRLVGYSCTYFQGVYGSLTALSVREIFSFIMLGSFLSNCGGINFFMKAGEALGGELRSRGAVTAVISSSLMGSVSGSIPANVAGTGCITIPMMIESGYTKERAGSVEAAASTGGQILPPVMGASAFIIADNLGISYGKVCLGAMLAAIVYYCYLLVAVQISAVKLDIPKGEKKNHHFWQTCKKEGYIMVCLIVLIIALAFNLPVQRAAMFAILSLIIVTAIKMINTNKGNIKGFFKDFFNFIINSLSEGAISGVKLGLIMGLMGVMVEMFVVTGFAQRLSFSMVQLAGNSLLLLLVLVAATCILFGCGMPTSGAYLCVALLGAPALITFGMPDLAAHMFVFYYAVMAAVTPPVGSAALVASGISGGSYMKTAIYSVQLTLPGFIMPFYFAYRPAILLLGYNPLNVLITTVTIFASIVCLGCAIERFMIVKLHIWQIALLVIGVAGSFIDNYLISLGCIAIFVIVFLAQYAEYKRKGRPTLNKQTA